MSTKHRLQFDFTVEALRELDQLQYQAGLPTKAELIRQSLRFFQWALKETADNAVILIEKQGKLKEVVFPFWPSLNNNAPKT